MLFETSSSWLVLLRKPTTRTQIEQMGRLNDANGEFLEHAKRADTVTAAAGAVSTFPTNTTFSLAITDETR